MGLLHSETGRMYLLLLFISAAFGRPSSAELESGVNQLNSLTDFTKDMGKMWNNSRLFGTVSEGLEEAEQNILEMEAELKTLQFEIKKLQNEENHFPEFNEAKSLLRKTRQELRELAKRTLSDERSLTLLLDGIDKSPATATQVTLLKIVIANMEDLTIETQEKLKAAREKYNKVHQASDNLQEAVAYSIQHTRLSGRTRILNRDIDDAIDVLTEEINQISYWNNRADRVSHRIDEYPAELLVKYETIRNAFKTLLVDLERSAENYLDHYDYSL